jgi:hypothetical protein
MCISHNHILVHLSCHSITKTTQGPFSNGSGCCIVVMVVHVCCKRLLSMFHLFFRMCVARVFYLDVVYVLHICCKCFYLVLACICNGFKCFFRCFFASVLDAFKCFIYFRMYVASVVLGCLKSRSGVASPSSPSVASPRCLLVFYCLASFSDYGGGAAGPVEEVHRGMAARTQVCTLPFFAT